MAIWDLNTIANVSTASAVVVAVVFGVVQARDARRKRAEMLIQEALHMAQAEHVVEAIQRALDLPELKTNAQFDALPHESKQAVWTAGYALESLGWMVYRRMLPLHDVDQLMGGSVRQLWHKLRPLMVQRRKIPGRQNALEWLQWLAEQMEKNPAPGKDRGAHVAFNDWEP